MNKEEIKQALERIADNIQKQMILEQNTGYRNEYSQTLKDKIDLYNEVRRLQERIDKAVECIEHYESIRGYYEYVECGYDEYNYEEDLKEELLEILKGEKEC